MGVTREQIAAEARTWVGTPFRHQARLKGVGVDCAGVVEHVGKTLGVVPNVKIMPYKMSPNSKAMRAELCKFLDQITFSQVELGDVLWFRIDVEGQHLGVVTGMEPMQMVHAFGREKVMKCIEQRVEGFWKQRLVGCFRYRGID